LYEDLWLAWGALRLGDQTSARRTLDFAQQHRDPESGGFQDCVTAEAAKLYDLRSTALGGLVSLDFGDLEIANAAAQFVVDLLAAQPKVLDEYYLVWDPQGGPVTSFPHERERLFVIRAHQEHPLHYALGLAVAFLGQLYSATCQERYLIAAEEYVRVLQGYGPSSFTHHYSGKLAWGLSLLLRVTGNDEYAAMLQQVVSYLAGLQSLAGDWWIERLFPNRKTQPLGVTTDMTAEYAVWLTRIAREVRAAVG